MVFFLLRTLKVGFPRYISDFLWSILEKTARKTWWAAVVCAFHPHLHLWRSRCCYSADLRLIPQCSTLPATGWIPRFHKLFSCSYCTSWAVSPKAEHRLGIHITRFSNRSRCRIPSVIKSVLSRFRSFLLSVRWTRQSRSFLLCRFDFWRGP